MVSALVGAYLEGAPEFVDSDMEFAADSTFGRVLLHSGSVLPAIEITRSSSILEGENVNNLYIKCQARVGSWSSA